MRFHIDTGHSRADADDDGRVAAMMATYRATAFFVGAPRIYILPGALLDASDALLL